MVDARDDTLMNLGLRFGPLFHCFFDVCVSTLWAFFAVAASRLTA